MLFDTQAIVDYTEQKARATQQCTIAETPVVVPAPTYLQVPVNYPVQVRGRDLAGEIWPTRVASEVHIGDLLRREDRLPAEEVLVPEVVDQATGLRFRQITKIY